MENSHPVFAIIWASWAPWAFQEETENSQYVSRVHAAAMQPGDADTRGYRCGLKATSTLKDWRLTGTFHRKYRVTVYTGHVGPLCPCSGSQDKGGNIHLGCLSEYCEIQTVTTVRMITFSDGYWPSTVLNASHALPWSILSTKLFFR